MQISFGKNLKKIRSVHNLSQQIFADIFDLKRGTLGAYEEGRSNPKLETVIKIANHFSIGIEELLTGELTVNRLVKFNERITTEKEAFTKKDFDGIPCILLGDKPDFITNYSKTFDLENYPVVKLPYIESDNRIAFSVDDLSMTGGSVEFFPKDIVIGFACEISTLVEKSWVVALANGELLFRKCFFEGENYVLKADHHGVEDVTILPEHLVAVWKIEHVFHQGIHSKAIVLENRLAAIEENIASLRNKKTT